jgi:hypothetical protein
MSNPLSCALTLSTTSSRSCFLPALFTLTTKKESSISDFPPENCFFEAPLSKMTAFHAW